MSPLNNPFYIKGGMKSIKKTYINVSSTNITNSYIIVKHVVEEALKERHLKGRFVRAVILWTL